MVVFGSVFGSLNLTTVKLSGVGHSFQKHADAESKGIKAHFNMDESGVLLLDRVRSSTVKAPVGSIFSVNFCRAFQLPGWKQCVFFCFSLFLFFPHCYSFMKGEEKVSFN